MKKFIIALITIMLLLVGGVYGAGVWYFTDHFLLGTVINGDDFSFKTMKDVEQRLKDKTQVYALAVLERNQGCEKITAEEIGMSYRAENRLQTLLDEQNTKQWFQSFRNQVLLNDAECIAYDTKMLKDTIDALSCMQEEYIVHPQDATYKDAGDTYVAVQEVEGNELDKEKTYSVIADAVINGKKEVDLDASGCYKEPEIRVSNPQFQANIEKRNTYTQAIITYDFGDRSERVDRTLIDNWLKVDETQDLVIDQVAVEGYVAELAQKYDVVGQEREFRTYENRKILVSGGNYGWIIDQNAETEALISDIENGTIDVREPVYKISGVTRKRNGAGDTYLEINLAAQRMVMYKNGSLILDTDIVSGNVGGTPTPTGFFAAGKKEMSVYLEDERETVRYWIPFTDRLGVHDASWRDEFGGDLYVFFGTYGGIDIPLDAAKIVYDNLEEGDPVVIYS